MKRNIPRVLPADVTTAQQIAEMYTDEAEGRVVLVWADVKRYHQRCTEHNLNLNEPIHYGPEVAYAVVYRAVLEWYDMDILVHRASDMCYILWVLIRCVPKIPSLEGNYFNFDANMTHVQREGRLLALHRWMFPAVAIPSNPVTKKDRCPQPPVELRVPLVVGSQRQYFVNRFIAAWVLAVVLAYLALVAVDHGCFIAH